MTRDIADTRIAVLNYNGKSLMAECLPSIVEAARFAKRTTTVTVLDNRSTDGSIEFLKANFPGVHIASAPENRILFSYNHALKHFREDVVILLNNDVRVDKGFVDPLIDPFETDENVFAVGSKCLDFDGGGFQGEKSIAGIRFGLFWTDSRYRGYERDMNRPSWTAHVALGAFDRKKFLALGGYDDLYFPGIWEDTDLSFRAYRRGWHCLYEPKSVIYHKGQVSFDKEYGTRERMTIAYRNAFLFMWKNFSGPGFLLSQVFFVPLRLLFAALKGKKEFFAGFIRAVSLRNAALSRKNPDPSREKRTHREVLSIVGSRDRGFSR